MTETELNTKINLLGGLMKNLADQKAEFEKRTQDLSEQIDRLKIELRSEFVERKESLATDSLIIQYRKGSLRWDTEMLNVYAKSHPEMSMFRKAGDPTVAFYLPKEENERM